MAESYDNNGYSGSDFKRNTPQEHVSKGENDQDGEDATSMPDKAAEYVKEILSEKQKIEQGKFPISIRLLDQEASNVQTTGRVPPRDARYVDIYREKHIRVSVKVLVPVKEHPKFNFVGKLLGPKGNSMKRLQEETMCKMAILGRGSMKDRVKETELRNSQDPKYAHLNEDLHVEISALGPPAEAHARIAFALAEVRKYLIPDANDVIRQAQLRELMEPGAPRTRPPYLPHPAHPHHYEDPYESTALVSSRHHAEVDEYATGSGAHYASAYEPAPRHQRAPPPVEHVYYRHHDGSPAAISTTVTEAYHYPRDHPDYLERRTYTVRSGSSAARSYKAGAAEVARRPHSDDTRYRPTPYSRQSK